MFCILLHCDLLDRNGPQLPQYSLSKHGDWLMPSWSKIKLRRSVLIVFQVKNTFLGNIDKSQVRLYEQNKSNETIWRLLINTVPAYMPIDEMPIVRPFVHSVCVAQNVLYSTIVMVYFKQKSYVVKSDPQSIAKLNIESHIKVVIGEQLFRFRVQ